MTTAIFCPDGHAHSVSLDGAGFETYGFYVGTKGPCRWNRFRIMKREAAVPATVASGSLVLPSHGSLETAVVTQDDA